MDRPVFVGTVRDGRLHLSAPAQFRAYLRRFEADEIEVEVRKRRSRRSLTANAYYWAAVIPPIARHCGYTDDEMHEALKEKFLGRDDLERGLRRIGSTAALDSQAFGNYIDQVTLWAAETLGVIVDPPTEQRV
jgi:hypothetical protein